MMDPADAPDVVTLWDRAHTARKERRCDVCKEAISPGQRYQSTGYRIDGKFEQFVRHEFGERYPSGCPSLADPDRAELATQFAQDQAMFQ